MRRAQRFGLLVMFLASGLVWPLPEATAQARRSSRSKDFETIKLSTRDGVVLKISYYPSSEGKDAVPVVMLHDFKESRSVFNGVAQALQRPANAERPSHAVITVDLRGHGGSTTVEGPNGQTRELESARFGTRDFRNMVTLDMEAVRKFLKKKNDAGELNLNKLCIIGSGMGASVGTCWAAVDWSAPKLASRKQGQDVKGLVLVSPEWAFKGLPLLKPLRQPGVREKISMMVIYGKEDRKATKSATTIKKNLERYHPEPKPEEGPEAKDFIVLGLPTSLQGTRLLADPNFGMLQGVEFFLDARLSQQEFDWIQRRRN